MMNSSNDNIHTLLEGLIECTGQLRLFGWRLCHHYKGSTWTTTHLFYRARDNGHYIPVGGLMTFSDSVALQFTVAIEINADLWMISAAVETEFTDKEGGKSFWEWPEQRTSNIEEAMVFLKEATERLIAYGEATDLTKIAENAK